jgi:hypothetical protein
MGHHKVSRHALPVGSSSIYPPYFENYVELVCSHEENSKACVEGMVVPDIERQREIVAMYSSILNTYPVEYPPSVRYTLWGLLVSDNQAMLTRMLDLLTNYSESVIMIGELMRSL